MNVKVTLAAAVFVLSTGRVAAQTVTAFKAGEESTAISRLCFYKALGNRYTLTIGANDICPESMQVQAPTGSSDAAAPDYDRFNPPPGCTQSDVLMGTCHPDPAAAPAKPAASRPAPASSAGVPASPATARARPAAPIPAASAQAASPADTTLIAPRRAASAFERKGFYIGVGLGYGGLDVTCGIVCEDVNRTGGFSGFFHLGGAVNPQVLLGVETNGWYKRVDGTDLTMGNLSFTVTGYPSKSGPFFLKAGVGASIIGVGSDSETGFGASGGLGFDVPIGSHTAITPFGNWFFGSFQGGGANTIQVGLGINAY